MRVYVAGKLADKKQINVAQELVRQAGHTISYDWTRFEGSPREAADRDLQGVLTADAVILLFTDPAYAFRGTYCELGAALASKKKILAVCPDPNAECRTNCFFHATGVQHFSSLDEAIANLV